MQNDNKFFVQYALSMILLSVQGVACAADVKYEYARAMLGSFLDTRYGVLPLDILHRIATFLAPRQDCAFPFDFVSGATIIPWKGKLYDIYRDQRTEHVKVLMGQHDKSLTRLLVGNVSNMTIEKDISIDFPRGFIIRDIYFSADPNIIEMRWNPSDAPGEDHFIAMKNIHGNPIAIGPELLKNYGLNLELHMTLREARAHKPRSHNKEIIWNLPDLTLPGTSITDVNSPLSKLWLAWNVTHVDSEQVLELVSDYIACKRTLLGFEKFNRGVELCQEEGMMMVNCVRIRSNLPPGEDSPLFNNATYELFKKRSVILPACCHKTNTFAPMKTDRSDCVVLNIGGTYVCFDFRAAYSVLKCSPKLKIFLHNIIKEGSFKDYAHISSIDSLPKIRRKKIIENLRVFCNVTFE